MLMDRTLLFKASVKACRLRLKIQLKDGQNDTDKKPSKFAVESIAIVKHITEIRSFLLDKRKEYLNVRCFLSDSSEMSDFEREQLDSDMENAFKVCQKLLHNLKECVKAEKILDQQKLHQELVIALIESYLKEVCKIFTEQRAIRIKKAVDMKRISRLETLAKNSKWLKKGEWIVPQEYLRLDYGSTKPLPSANNEHKRSLPAALGTPSTSKAKSGPVNNGPKHSLTLEPGATVLRQRKKPTQVSSVEKSDVSMHNGNVPQDNNSSYKAIWSEWQHSLYQSDEFEELGELPSHEKAQLQKENEQLYGQMNSMVDEIKQIEGRVVEITKLQEVFTEKVLEQDTQINVIHDTSIKTTENVKFGNEQLREAMKKKAGFRVWVLFFLIVMSFTLLFLDWYNP